MNGITTMNAYRIETILDETGTLRLRDLPFQAGDAVEIIILERRSPHPDSNPYPLRGKQPYRYDDPTEPVAVEDWEVLQ